MEIPRNGMHGDPGTVVDEPPKRQQEYCAQVIDAITSKLKALGDSSLIERIAKKMQERAAGKTLAIDHNSTPDILARQIATCMVKHMPVTAVVPALINLTLDLSPNLANQLADIIDDVLPLNYAPDVLQDLHTQITKERFGLVENAVTLPTLAEIIMAGYDQKLPMFDVTTDGSARLRGRPALDYLQEPEEGPGDSAGDAAQLLPAVRNFLYDLRALLDVIPARASGLQDEAAMQKEITDYATRLQGRLRARSRMFQRTVYCVLQLPEASQQRDFRTRVLRTISEKLNSQDVALVFVELMVHKADPDQEEMAEYIAHIQHNIRARYVRTQ